MAANPKAGPPGAAGNSPANQGTQGSGAERVPESGVVGVKMVPPTGTVDNQITPGATTEAGKATAEQAGAGKQQERPDVTTQQPRPNVGGDAMRPDVTTQQPRPNVGGDAMPKAHPELGPSMETMQDRFPNPVSQTIEQARERSKSGNVYVVTQTILGCEVPVGGIAADVDLPKNSDFVHLMRVGALAPAEPLKSDPSATVRSVEHLDDLEELQQRCERLDSENDRLSAENARLTAENARLTAKD